MKKQITTIVATISLIVTLAAIGIAGFNQSITANVPFDFNVGGKTLPAGKYLVVKGSTPGALIISNREAGKAAIIVTRNVYGKETGKAALTFRRYGNQYFWAGATDGVGSSEIQVGDAERAAARGKDNLAIAPEVVTVGATVGQ